MATPAALIGLKEMLDLKRTQQVKQQQVDDLRSIYTEKKSELDEAKHQKKEAERRQVGPL